jgi:two-component system clock-associated histidine kinase SasA
LILLFLSSSVLQSYNQHQEFGKDPSGQGTLQLLLFIDERPTAQENIQCILSYLENLQAEHFFRLQVIQIGKQPHLVEHYKLVATPALVKISPHPRQTLAGSNLIDQLKKWWPRWQLATQQEENDLEVAKANGLSPELNSISYSGELIKLTDQIFSLQKDKEELLEQLRFKDQILAMLAHDLRSPLTAASIAVETLELSYDKEETERTRQLREQLFQQARKQFRIMNRMIGELLQTSKSMTAKLRVEPQRLYLQTLCQDILHQFANQLRAHSLELEVDIPQDIPPVYADEELVRQLIINLLDNAVKYTPTGGEIGLSILHRTSQKIQVSIYDTGPGIPPEKQERIFEGHFRLQRDEAKEGYGLGLALCRKIVRAHYGQIWVDSSSDRGSCFHFTLPVYR